MLYMSFDLLFHLAFLVSLIRLVTKRSNKNQPWAGESFVTGAETASYTNLL